MNRLGMRAVRPGSSNSTGQITLSKRRRVSHSVGHHLRDDRAQRVLEHLWNSDVDAELARTWSLYDRNKRFVLPTDEAGTGDYRRESLGQW